MTHLHKRSGQTFEVGSYISPNDNKTYDITIISYWKDAETQGIGSPVEIVGYYFGDYDEETTDYYIDQWLANRAKEISVLQEADKCFDAYLVTNEGLLDPNVESRIRQAVTECCELLEDRSWKFEFKPVSEKKMTRTEYLRYIENMYAEDKIDEDAMDALVALACNYPD